MPTPGRVSPQKFASKSVQGAQQEKAAPPVPQASARDKALQAIEGTRKEVDALEEQVCARPHSLAGSKDSACGSHSP